MNKQEIDLGSETQRDRPMRVSGKDFTEKEIDGEEVGVRRKWGGKKRSGVQVNILGVLSV